MLAIDHIQNNATKNQFTIDRPHITNKQIIEGLVFPILVIVSSVLFSFFNTLYPWWAFVSTLILTIVLFTKKFVVLLVLIYQKTAPEKIRKSCVFEPSCSNYMLMSIDKYGVWIGVFKGIKRLLRCHPPNGGQDWP